jgi:succinyl-diaminopimelate desuccinylase
MFDFLLNLPSGVIVMEIEGGVNFNTVPSHSFLEIDLATGNFDAMSSKISTIYRGISELEKKFLEVEDQDFFPKHPTLNIGVVKTYDDHVVIGGCCRIPPSVSNSQYEVWMEFLKQKCHSVGAEFRITDYKRPFRTEENGIFSRGCRAELEAMGIKPILSTQASTNEASLFSRIGVECLCFGPGKREENIHTPNEHVAVEDLNRAVDFYRRIIERFCK